MQLLVSPRVCTRPAAEKMSFEIRLKRGGVLRRGLHGTWYYGSSNEPRKKHAGPKRVYGTYV